MTKHKNAPPPYPKPNDPPKPQENASTANYCGNCGVKL